MLVFGNGGIRPLRELLNTSVTEYRLYSILALLTQALYAEGMNHSISEPIIEECDDTAATYELVSCEVRDGIVVLVMRESAGIVPEQVGE